MTRRVNPTLVRALVLVCASAVVSACGVPERLGLGRSAEPEAVLPFSAKLTEGDQMRQFSVRVNAGGAGLAEVRESARFPATAHCLLDFGGSDIDWNTGADGDWLVARDDADLIVSGACASR